jgi:D-tagatose-1,6-bisphosphate aldolase subunit GatZ/KbaZ
VVKRKNARDRGDATRRLREILSANRRGKGLGIYSICSANRFVIEAGMLQAARDESLLLIESTSNQVNQFGGYTGQTPAGFARFVQEIASAVGFQQQGIILGGDHLGPHVWRNMPAKVAMEKASDMVAAYVHAGFSKIHLDASMPCADDQAEEKGTLPDEIVADRAAELCRVAEKAHSSGSSPYPMPLYVIGTEVPIPGGEVAGSQAPQVTRTKDLSKTLKIAKQAFVERGLAAAWERVIAVVVQPGVEFGDSTVFKYDSKKARPLCKFLAGAWAGVYEAHSTDYQTTGALREMVLDHFAILKVGPWLTFAFREAVFALAAIEKEWLCNKAGVVLSGLPEILEAAMLKNPADWKNYYHGGENDLRIARKYSYSDRCRYYWPEPSVDAALQRLLKNLHDHPAPVSLSSQYLPRQADRVRAGKINNEPTALIHHKILEVLNHYAYAAGCYDGKPREDSRPLC